MAAVLLSGMKCKKRSVSSRRVQAHE